MKGYLGALTALAMIANIGLAFAEEASGKLAEIDEEGRTIVLEDGTTFIVAEGVPMDGLEAGADVTVSFEMEGDVKVADSINPKE